MCLCGQSGVSVTEGGTGDTLFLNGRDGHGPDTDRQVSLCLHLTATGKQYVTSYTFFTHLKYKTLAHRSPLIKQ